MSRLIGKCHYCGGTLHPDDDGDPAWWQCTGCGRAVADQHIDPGDTLRVP